MSISCPIGTRGEREYNRHRIRQHAAGHGAAHFEGGITMYYEINEELCKRGHEQNHLITDYKPGSTTARLQSKDAAPDMRQN